ncbi:dimethylarginine dimethylaminohydrolase family protein [Agarivorans sp. 1_MG-2023]|uniref:dimethylarginine dimethylaminohydrolase family protein n=1 Tax=Agarivorans sp. 1_MG-2023 TaxID=3062634 RepID=UPI0026E36E7F|nr:arginine deiminase family protein [Agarivorans sp. 1_MG-2023]MDO6765679.1 arginine deiminase family protein [Agarivorans sp. 1_MG-2023]
MNNATLAKSTNNSDTLNQQATSNKVEVNHEWGTLKEVLVGRPFVYMPKELPAYMRSWLNDKALAVYDELQGRSIEEVFPELHQKQVTQINNVISVLEENGVKVHQVAEQTQDEHEFLKNQIDSYQSYTYMRDAVVVIGNHFIETNMFDPGRRRDRFAIRRTLGERLNNSNAKIVSMPESPIIVDDNGFGPGPFLEGGDTFVLGKTILVGNSGNASNTAGIEWLQRYLGEEYEVIEVKLDSKFVHLDCVLCTLRPGLAMIVKDAFLDGIPDVLKGWDFINVSAEDAKLHLAANALVINDQTVMMPDSLKHISTEVRAKGHQVIEVPFDAINWQGGSFRCFHHPIVRES